MHSHDYKGDDPDFFRDKTVVVLGMGNSAMDIAVEASFVAEHTYLAARRGAHVIPKYLFGKPIDQIGALAEDPVRGPPADARRGCSRSRVGDMERYGLPKPDHRFGDAHPTVSDDILSRMAHGTITAKPNIALADARHGVRFADGSEVEADVVVYCTGYKVTFPFFDEGFISAPDNDLPLFRRTFHPDIPNVFFIGLLQPLGAIMPIAEAQAEWVSDYLAGRYALPAPADLRADMEDERRRMFKRYVASKRHTMQVDFDDWMAALGQGAQGAGRSGRGCAATRCRCRPRARRAGRGVSGALAGGRREAHEGRQPRRDPRRGRATSSPSSATARRACATSCAAPSSRRARSTTTSPTRSRCSARSCTRSARRRGGACGRARQAAATPRAFVEDAYRAYFSFIVEDAGARRVPLPQRRRDPGHVRGVARRRRASTSWPPTCAPRSPPGWCRSSTSSCARRRWWRSRSSWASG